jgi:hypothetical protein
MSEDGHGLDDELFSVYDTNSWSMLQDILGEDSNHENQSAQAPSQHRERGSHSPHQAKNERAPVPDNAPLLYNELHPANKRDLTNEDYDSSLPKNKKKRVRLKNFVCSDPSCGKAFADNAHLRDHMLSHTGTKSFSCEECGKFFARKTSLKAHQRIHTGEKPFACEQCGKAYASRGGLKLHKVVHTGIRPFFCEIPGCNKTFAVAQQLKKHASRHKQLEGFETPKSGKEDHYSGEICEVITETNTAIASECVDSNETASPVPTASVDSNESASPVPRAISPASSVTDDGCDRIVEMQIKTEMSSTSCPPDELVVTEPEIGMNKDTSFHEQVATEASLESHRRPFSICDAGELESNVMQVQGGELESVRRELEATKWALECKEAECVRIREELSRLRFLKYSSAGHT